MKKTLSILVASILTITATFAKGSTFKTEIQPVYNVYLTMAQQLSQSNVKAVYTTAVKFKKSINSVNEAQLSGNDLKTWQSTKKRLLELDNIIMHDNGKRIYLQRRAFRSISGAMIPCMKITQSDTPIYLFSKSTNGIVGTWMSNKKVSNSPYTTKSANSISTLKDFTLKKGPKKMVK